MQATTYELDLGTDGKVVFLMGEIDHGITKSLEALFDKNRDVTNCVLQSPGGTPFEGRGIARIIRHHGLIPLLLLIVSPLAYSLLSPERREHSVLMGVFVFMATDWRGAIKCPSRISRKRRRSTAGPVSGRLFG